MNECNSLSHSHIKILCFFKLLIINGCLFNMEELAWELFTTNIVIFRLMYSMLVSVAAFIKWIKILKNQNKKDFRAEMSRRESRREKRDPENGSVFRHSTIFLMVKNLWDNIPTQGSKYRSVFRCAVTFKHWCLNQAARLLNTLRLS